MGVTNYYSAGGMLIGHKAAGQPRVDYLTDALGSVTATVNQSAAVQGTTRYKPYGETLATTGTPSDTEFAWVGSHGYRQTRANYNNVYVRARHYASGLGRWTTLDPLGYTDGLSRYLYVRANATTAIDPSGRIQIILALVTAGPVKNSGDIVSTCGQEAITWVFQPDKQPAKKGVLVQEATRVTNIAGCNGEPATWYPEACKNIHIWEVLEISPGEWPGTDKFTTNGYMGYQTSEVSFGEMRFYTDEKVIEETKKWLEGCSGCSMLNSPRCTKTEPSFWKQSGAETPAFHGLSGNSCCCPSGQAQTAAWFPSGSIRVKQ